MSGIFISYRRGDAEGQARALSIELTNYVSEGSVFMDVDSIALGRDFRQSLHESLESCDALLALIGPGWLDSKDAAGRRRLDDPADFVRQEIAAALKRNIPVTPVLLQGTPMPALERLPDDLKDLAFRNGFELSHSRWRSDVRELVQRLGLAGDSATDAQAKTQRIEIKPPSARRPATAGIRAAEAPGAAQAPARLTRRRALGAVAVAIVAAGSAVAVPSIRRLLSRPAKPSFRTVAVDFAIVDEKGALLPTEKGSASIFTEMLTSGVGIDMVALPGGAFIMGSPKYEPERRANEGLNTTSRSARSS